MAAGLVIEKFVPPRFSRASLNLGVVERLFNKQLHYATNGRSALHQIIAANPCWTKMLIPTYVCSSVLIPLRKANIEPIFYDIDLKDLNADIDSLEYLADRHSVRTALLPSMYGNPADLARAETLCQNKGICLIDDAAQSFGARLNGRYVGAFGDAGFFSISPGKPLAGPMGAFYWSDKSVAFKQTRHDLIHYIKWMDFCIRRLNAYTSRKFIALNPLLEYGTVALTKVFDLSLDAMAPFESSILGGLLSDAMSGHFAFRQKYFDEFSKRFPQSNYFSLVRSLRGTPSNHKIVLRCVSPETSLRLRSFLTQRHIYSNGGYPLLSPGNKHLKNAARIDGCIVELPIEDDDAKMAYMFEVVQEFNDG
jgi:DegT/DnrJ/EryC1/StrS aminotransferase family